MYPLEPGAEYGIHLRATTPLGGKDWVGTIVNNVGVVIYWGKTGRITQKAMKPGTRISLDHIVAEKLAKGYIKIDEYTPLMGCVSENTKPAKQPFAAKPIYIEDITKTITIEGAQKWDF